MTWRTRHEAPPAPPPPLSDEALLKTRYAEAYRKLIALARDEPYPPGFARRRAWRSTRARRGRSRISMARSSSRSTTSSPPTPPTIGLCGCLRQQSGVPLIDAAVGLDGAWDDDLYLDIVHFTDRGNRREAELIFRDLLPILESEGLRCSRP